MRIGNLDIKFNWGSAAAKTWEQLDAIIARQKGGGAVPLKINAAGQLKEYKSWVYSCVSLISDRVSMLPFSFYNSVTGEELNTSNKGYKTFTKPFLHPNDLMTFRFIKNFCQIQLDMCGMTVLYKARNRLGQVWELWPLNMNDYMKVDVSGGTINPSVKYTFKSGTTGYIEFDINELIVINYPHPVDPWSGMSPIQAQAYAVDIDTYVEVYERDFFKNSARIDFALTTDAQIDQEKADELKARWMEKYKGTFHQVAVLDSGLKPIPIEYTNKDFEFLSLAGWSKEKILSAYRVPTNKLGSTDSNRAGAVYTDISFNRESIAPRLNIWDEELTEGVCKTYDERLQVKHKNPIPRDRQLEVQESKAYVGVPTMTINEFRQEVQNKPAVTGGDEIIIPANFVLLKDLPKISSQAANPPAPANNGDRDRDDEEPHTNPDGTDDRDDNPTDGRSATPANQKQVKLLDHFYELIQLSRTTWNGMIFQAMKDIHPRYFEEQLKHILVDCLQVSVEILSKHFGYQEKLEWLNDPWIEQIADKAAFEYNKTIKMIDGWENKDWKEFFTEQFNANPRLSKIINALLKSCINYTKWRIINSENKNVVWVVNSNECGHKGRIDKVISKDFFMIKNAKLRFPGDILSFNCDCTITTEKE